jgi:hypothetical protein
MDVDPSETQLWKLAFAEEHCENPSNNLTPLRCTLKPS